ncbi:MAG: DNA alkylation repair protein [Chitinophagaceae bacterium]
MTGNAKKIIAELKHKASTEKAAFFPRFFKTGKGQYGEGDQFIGVTVPDQRIIAKKYLEEINEYEIKELLHSAYHESRLTGLIILSEKFKKDFKKGDGKNWVDVYLKNIDRVNNWDLVDASAPYILGPWLEKKDKSILYKFADTNSLWRQRISIVATFYFIKQGQINDTLSIAELLLHHEHDLIHKAVGWMLREAWKKEPGKIEKFISRHLSNMPRTMLRYAIEKMPEPQRKSYLLK